MNNAARSSAMPLALTLVAAALLLLSLTLPLWQMRLEAPQYREQEALHVAVYPHSLRGDLKELSVLDQYIGVHVPSTLPQFKWLPGALAAAAALGLGSMILRGSARARALAAVSGALAAALLGAAVQAKSQMHDIGHKRDQKTVLASLRDFTPPFLGSTKIAQFEVSSRFGAGAWLIGGALLLQLGAAWSSRSSNRNKSFSLAPGFSPVEPSREDLSAATTASRAHTGLKSGARESALLCSDVQGRATSVLP